MNEAVRADSNGSVWCVSMRWFRYAQKARISLFYGFAVSVKLGVSQNVRK
jgi:hypothetical protein